MVKGDLEEKTCRAVIEIKKKVDSIYTVLKDVGMKLTHVIEYKFDYHTLPNGIDYNGS